MIWTRQSPTEFSRAFGVKKRDGSIAIQSSDVCRKDTNDRQRTRQTPGRIDFSLLRFPPVELPASLSSGCPRGYIAGGASGHYFYGTAEPSLFAGSATVNITPGVPPPGIVAAIGFFVFDSDPPEYFTGDSKSFLIVVPNTRPGQHPYWIGTLYLDPNGTLRQVHVEIACASVLGT